MLLERLKPGKVGLWPTALPWAIDITQTLSASSSLAAAVAGEYATLKQIGKPVNRKFAARRHNRF